jgi:hypothetical protein
LTFLRAQHGPNNTFMVADGLAETLGWTRKRLAHASRRYRRAGLTLTGSGALWWSWC